MQRQQVRNSVLAALIAVAISGPGAWAQQKSIEQRLQELEQEIQLLKQQQAVAKEATATAARPADAPLIKAGKDGFSIQSADGDYKLRVGGYLQADGRFYLHDTGGKTGTAGNGVDTFVIRRARPIFEGTVMRDFDYKLMLDVGNGAGATTLLEDAYVEWKYLPWLKVRGGKFKPEVGLEWQQPDTSLPLIERGLPSFLLPNRDVGFQVSGDLFNGVVHYSGGVYNGVVDGGIADLDSWDAKDGAARLFVQPFKTTTIKPLQGLGVGVAGTIGNQQYTTTTTNFASYKSVGQNTVFTFGKNAAPDGLELRGTPQAYYYWGPFGLLTEYAFAQQELRNGAVRDNVRNSAWQIETSFVLTGEKAGFGGVTPLHPFDLKKGGWGALELAGRYGELRFDQANFSTSTAAAGQRFADPTASVQEEREWGVGLNWYLNRNVKLALDYEQTAFDGGAGTTVGTAYKVKNRQTEQTVFTRAQVAF